MSSNENGVYFLNTDQPEILNCYITGLLTVNWEGPWASSITGKSIGFERIGDAILLSIEGIEGAATTESAISLVSTYEMPNYLRPQTNQQCVTLVQDNGGLKTAMCEITTLGQVKFYNGYSSLDDFTASGNAGINTNGKHINISYFAK